MNRSGELAIGRKEKNEWADGIQGMDLLPNSVGGNDGQVRDYEREEERTRRTRKEWSCG